MQDELHIVERGKNSCYGPKHAQHYGVNTRGSWQNDGMILQDVYGRPGQVQGSLDYRVSRISGQNQLQNWFSNTKKEMAVDTYFIDRKFSTHEVPAFDETIVNFEIRARMLSLSDTQR